MAELAIKPMGRDEFLTWDDGTERRYELIGGFPVAMAPPAEAHSMLAVQLVTRIDASRRPCRALIEAGILRPSRADTYFVADIAATCAPVEPGRQAIKDPFLIVEIPSRAPSATTAGSSCRHIARSRRYRKSCWLRPMTPMPKSTGAPGRSGSPRFCGAAKPR